MGTKWELWRLWPHWTSQDGHLDTELMVELTKFLVMLDRWGAKPHTTELFKSVLTLNPSEMIFQNWLTCFRYLVTTMEFWRPSTDLKQTQSWNIKPPNFRARLVGISELPKFGWTYPLVIQTSVKMVIFESKTFSSFHRPEDSCLSMPHSHCRRFINFLHPFTDFESHEL